MELGRSPLELPLLVTNHFSEVIYAFISLIKLLLDLQIGSPLLLETVPKVGLVSEGERNPLGRHLVKGGQGGFRDSAIH